MRILCNIPLDCFDERSAMQGVELVTYGPNNRLLVGAACFPFDVSFDPSTGSWEELEAALPPGYRPDLLLLYWPDQEPLPAGLEHCPVPIVGVFAAYNLSLPYLAGLWPFFDVVLCDRAGQDLFRRLSFADVRYWCHYAHERPHHRLRPEAGRRDFDVGFAGNLDPVVQRERAPWLDRVRRLECRGVRVEIQSGLQADHYGAFLNRCRIGWNRSIRGEMNRRAFEVPACGATLLMERENLEIRDFFVPDEECVLYDDGDFESVVQELLADRVRCERIATAGHRRVQDHRLGKRLGQLETLLSQPGPGRPTSSAADRVLGRAVAMLPTWAAGQTIAAAALAAHDLEPDDPRTLNLLGMATLRWRGIEGGEAAWRLWQRAAAVAPSYLPATANLAAMATATGDATLQASLRRDLEKRSAAPKWADLDGPTLPIGCAERAIDRSLAMQAAVRTDQPAVFAKAMARGLALRESP